MNSGLKRSLVSAEQLSTLLDFMKEHPELAQGLNRGRRGKLMTVKVWGTCAKKLNAIEGGASKNGKGWSKYWCDWKYRVRRHALELKAAREANQMGSDVPAPLSSMELTIIDIIGEGGLEGIVIKTDPLADDNEQDGEASVNYETRAKRRKRRNVSKDNNTSDSDDNMADSRSSFQNKSKIKNGNDSEKKAMRRNRRIISKDNNIPDCDDNMADSDDNMPDSDNNMPNSRRSIEHKKEIKNGNPESEDDEAAQFLDIERRKLQAALDQADSSNQISVALNRLVDVLEKVKDIMEAEVRCRRA